MTSHALTSGGAESADRDLLVRFDLRGDTIANAVVAPSLKPQFARLHPTLAAAVEKRPKRKGNGLNVEAVAWDPIHRRLLFGLRSPLVNGSAIVLALDNAPAVFEQGAAPVVSGPLLLPLEGDGIRDLTYDAEASRFLIVAGAARESYHAAASLWSWDGRSSAVTHLRAPVLVGVKPEGVALVDVRGHRALLLVCDDGFIDVGAPRGRRRRGTPSRYVLIPYDTLRRWNPSSH
jgi:Protein of unknown function (DUF3616)